jgi:predicted RNase H-like HicB family nuclease
MDVRIYRILLKPEPEGGYKVLVPALPGCITYGETIEEARAMATEAIALYVEELQARNEEISDDNDTLEYSNLLKTA